MTTAKQATAKATKKSAPINAVTAQAGIAITVQTKTSATIKALKPLVSAMNIVGDETSAELLARLPQNTVAFQHFANQALGTAQLFAWFSSNQTRLTRKTKEGKSLLDIAGAYCAAFNIVHDRAVDGPLKNMPFYKRLSNALQQWAKKHPGGVGKRASGSISDAIAAYLNKKQQEDSKALEDSIVVWVLKHEDVLERIKRALETPAV